MPNEDVSFVYITALGNLSRNCNKVIMSLSLLIFKRDPDCHCSKQSSAVPCVSKVLDTKSVPWPTRPLRAAVFRQWTLCYGFAWHANRDGYSARTVFRHKCDVPADVSPIPLETLQRAVLNMFLRKLHPVHVINVSSNGYFELSVRPGWHDNSSIECQHKSCRARLFNWNISLSILLANILVLIPLSYSLVISMRSASTYSLCLCFYLLVMTSKCSPNDIDRRHTSMATSI